MNIKIPIAFWARQNWVARSSKARNSGKSMIILFKGFHSIILFIEYNKRQSGQLISLRLAGWITRPLLFLKDLSRRYPQKQVKWDFSYISFSIMIKWVILLQYIPDDIIIIRNWANRREGGRLFITITNSNGSHIIIKESIIAFWS